MADENGVTTVPAVDPIAEKDALITKLTDERDNYKNVALKRLGKLPGDDGFVAGVNETTGLTVEETVRKTLVEQKIIEAEEAKNAEIKRVMTENSELKLALANQPGATLGGSGSGSSTDVKDNVFSEAQLADLRKRAERLKTDPEKFIEAAKANILARR